MVGGQVPWRSARQRQRLAEQAATIDAPPEELRRQVAEQSLRAVEASSRVAVGQMRGLLGMLRAEGDPGEDAERAPEPGLVDVPELTATCEIVEDPPGVLARAPHPVGLSRYRTVQEALATVEGGTIGEHVGVVAERVSWSKPTLTHGSPLTPFDTPVTLASLLSAEPVMAVVRRKPQSII